MNQKNVSKNQLRRYPVYLEYLKQKEAEGIKYISSPQIADSLNLSEEQVRKDFNLISRNSGKPKVGREIKLLIFDIEEFLGYRDTQTAVLVGAGHLGRALMAHDGFLHYGLNITCAFDNDINKVDCIFYNKYIYPISKLEEKCKELNAHIGIIAVPQQYAQEICDKLINAGIKGIWNFSSSILKVSDDVIVQNVNMASSLAILSNKLKEKLYK